MSVDGPYAQPMYTGYMDVSWELCERHAVGSFGGARGNEVMLQHGWAEPAASMAYSETSGDNLSPNRAW